jgi:protein-tyrosine-phosphatase
VHNAGRSQMAAGLVKLRSNGRIRVRSAGSQPGETINPAVVEAMSEIGVDMSEAYPKPLTDEAVQAADVVITMGCGDACPIYPGKRYEDWVLDDPAGEGLDTVRRIRDEIDAKVHALIEQLLD